jgi:hypothetical protein
LPKDKVQRFKQLITIPLPTIELTESIFSHLNSVFKGQDAFFRYEFKDPENLSDWKQYRDDTFWQTHGFEAMMNAIDSVWIVNLPREQNNELPEPKDMFVNIKDVISISCDRDNNCEYLMFKANDKIYIYDDVYFWVYPLNKDKLSILPEAQIPHDLGYTPARMFWSDNLLKDNYINKKAPLTNVLGDLDWLLTCQVFKKYMEISNSYPILAAYEEKQDYNQSRQESDRGKQDESRDTDGGNFVAPGTILTVRQPLAGEPDPMQNPLKYINPDVNTLTFHVGDLKLKRDNIFYSVVGKDENTTKEAINEKQVMASFESQTANILKIARNFEIIQAFADKCKIQLRYGKDSLKAISIYYGSKFFLKSANDYIEDLDTAKKNGSHSSIISAIMDNAIEATYRNDTNGLSRAKIIQELDPLPDKTQDEAAAIFEKGGISKEQFIIKCQLLNFVKRFEREEVPLVEYASARPYKEKIRGIYEEFLLYAKEISGEQPVKTPALQEEQVEEIIK